MRVVIELALRFLQKMWEELWPFLFCAILFIFGVIVSVWSYEPGADLKSEPLPKPERLTEYEYRDMWYVCASEQYSEHVKASFKKTHPHSWRGYNVLVCGERWVERREREHEQAN